MSIGIDNDFRTEKIDPLYRDLFQSALPFLNTRNNLIHTYIVYQYACALLKKEPGDPEIVLPASILHDVGWSTIPATDQLKGFGPKISDKTLKRKHEVEGVAIAKNVLKSVQYEASLTKRILDIIDGHDTNEVSKSPEDAIVKDSDKLWRYSEAGFRIDVERFEMEPHVYIEALSDKIDIWFFTKEGRRIARHETDRRKRGYGI